MRLKIARKAARLTQQEVAEKIGVNQNTYSYWENEKTKIDNVSLVKLAALFGVTVDFLLDRDEIDPASLPNYIGPVVESKKIPIIGSVKCGTNGLAFEYRQGYVFIDDAIKGDIVAILCKGDSMRDVGISDGDIAIVRKQCTIENGEIAIVIIDGEEGTLKRVRYHDSVMILESANPDYQPRIFVGREMNKVKIFGKVIQVRKNF